MSNSFDGDRRKFIIKSTGTAVAVALGGSLSACSSSDSGGPISPAQFANGVASGDPLADRVILWTHAKFIENNNNVPLNWQVASDASFAAIVSS
ncbi:MAG: PhoD-like phosphatase N-terminal domain-containing protein, partial [Usitatibacteraceae bacterium]